MCWNDSHAKTASSEESVGEIGHWKPTEGVTQMSSVTLNFCYLRAPVRTCWFFAGLEMQAPWTHGMLSWSRLRSPMPRKPLK